MLLAWQVNYSTTAQNKGQFRILINRPTKTGVFSGDFNHGTNQSENAVATLNRTFSGTAVGLEVFSVVSEQLSPAELCASLKDSNEGKSSHAKSLLAFNEASDGSVREERRAIGHAPAMGKTSQLNHP